uniref:Uncharacterized protein n=1 Tax=Anopheles farauti TaxID=69004 RepID=A0A182QFC8_9DIPT
MSSMRTQHVRLCSASVENSIHLLIGTSSSEIAEVLPDSSSTTGAAMEEMRAEPVVAEAPATEADSAEDAAAAAAAAAAPAETDHDRCRYERQQWRRYREHRYQYNLTAAQAIGRRASTALHTDAVQCATVSLLLLRVMVMMELAATHRHGGIALDDGGCGLFLARLAPETTGTNALIAVHAIEARSPVAARGGTAFVHVGTAILAGKTGATLTPIVVFEIRANATCVPMKPGTHWHLKWFSASTHVPPFRQGLPTQSSTFSSQRSPTNPSGQRHINIPLLAALLFSLPVTPISADNDDEDDEETDDNPAEDEEESDPPATWQVPPFAQ